MCFAGLAAWLAPEIRLLRQAAKFFSQDRAAFSFQGVRKATQITAMHIIAMMATPIQTE
jgi:hypothetical protein